MLKLWAWLETAWRSEPWQGAGGRPEAMRRRAIAGNAKLILALSLIGMPAALYGLTQVLLLPFILATVGVATGVATLALCQRGQFERAAAGQVYATLLGGMLLTVADPGIADFGLAVAVLAPVHASLLTRTPVKKRAWSILVAVVSVGVAGHLGWLSWPEPFGWAYGLMAALVFAVAAVTVALPPARRRAIFA